MKLRWRRALGWTAAGVLGVLLLAPLLSREVRFLYRGAWELARIQWRARAIEDVLADSTTPEGTRAALALVVAARQYAVDSLGLDAGDSFRKFSDIGRDTLLLMLTASPHDTLAALTWWYPITGRVPYHGYYSLAAAERAAARLRRQGYDTYLRPASAFSTLGWLPDPLLSTSLAPAPFRRYIVITVMHELAHNTVWVPGHAEFSESLASLIGYRGAGAFFRARGDTAGVAQMDRLWREEQVLSDVQERLVADLRAAFADGRTRNERNRLRREAFARAHEALRAANVWGGRAIQTAMRDQNNAAVIAAGIYHADLEGLEAAYQACGGDIARLIAAVRAAGDSVPAQVLRLCDPSHGDGERGDPP